MQQTFGHPSHDCSAYTDGDCEECRRSAHAFAEDSITTVQTPGSLSEILMWWCHETDTCDQWADYVGLTEEALQKAFEAGQRAANGGIKE